MVYTLYMVYTVYNGMLRCIISFAFLLINQFFLILFKTMFIIEGYDVKIFRLQLFF